MPISDYLRGLRSKIGNDLVLVPSATALVFDERRRVVLVQHTNGGPWGIPGGAIDPGETPADAVVRETWEETGLYVEPLRIVGVYGGNRVRYENGDEVEYIATVFECRRIYGELRPDGDETFDVRYFEPSVIDPSKVTPWVLRVLRDASAGNPQAAFVEPVWRPVGGER